MAGFEIDGSAFARAADALEQAEFRKLADQTVGAVLVRGANAVRRRVRAQAASHRRTGKMAGRIQYSKTGFGLDTIVKVRAGGPVAHLVEGGTRAHEIRAGKGSGQLGGAGQALTIRGAGSVNSRWSGGGSKAVRGAGADVLAVRNVVRHPGTRAEPFFARGVADARDEVQQLVDAGAATMANNLAFRMSRKT